MPPRNARTESVSALLLCSVWVIELARMAHDAAALRATASVCLGVFTLLAWFRASAHIRTLFAIIVAASVAGAWWHGSPKPLAAGLAKALVFGAFFPAVLMLRATVEASPRLAELRSDLRGLNAASTEILTLLASHGLGTVINVGASAVLAPVVAAGAGDERRAWLASTSARGVAIAAMWSPFYVSIAFTTQLAPSVPLWEVIAVGLCSAFIGLAMSHVLFTASKGARLAASIPRLRALGLPTAVIVGTVVAGTLVFGWNGLHSVGVVVPALCFAYAWKLPEKPLARVLRSTFLSLGRVSDEVLIVMGGTILGAVVTSLPAVQQLGARVTPDMISGPAVIAALVALMLALGQLGVHPMITSSVLVPVIYVGNFGVCGVIAIATAVFAWALNATFSIWSLPMAMGASTFGVPVARLLNRRSATFAIAFAAVGVAFLSAVNAALRALGAP